MKGYRALSRGSRSAGISRAGIEFIFDTSLIMSVLSLEITILTLLFQLHENSERLHSLDKHVYQKNNRSTFMKCEHVIDLKIPGE